MSKPLYPKRVMIIAGEASGDIHGARLVTAMKKKNNELIFCGVGGNELKSAGVKIVIDSSKFAVVGITEAISKIFYLIKGMAKTKRFLKSFNPDLLILIDFPDFNLNIASAAKKLGIPVLYYISPQAWAWRQGRVKKIKKLVNHLAVILPFEETFFRKHGISVTYVGHPLLDGDSLPAEFEKKKDIPVVGLLPGSRDSEVARHLPVMLEAAVLIRKRMGNVRFVVSLASTVERQYVEKIIMEHSGNDFEVVPEHVRRVFEMCSLVVAASGTVTLEAAIAGIPMVIIYKVSPVSYWLGKILIKVSSIGLVNLIAGREIVPELIQGKASPINIANEILRILEDSNTIETMRNELAGIRNLLGGPGASERVADIAMGML